LADARTAVASALTKAMDDADVAARITGIKGAAHVRAVAANRSVRDGPVMPASQRYQGVVWDHLEPTALSTTAQRRARTSVLITSALHGIAGWDEPIPDYKLKMSTRLAPLGSLAGFWRQPVTAVLAGLAAEVDLVVDLLPLDHAKVVAFDELPAPTVHVVFTTRSGRAIGHGAKAAKGRFARHLLEVGGDPRRAATSFDWDGWRTASNPSGPTIEVQSGH
jgi:cytoplasmic iron level regulating protein YaaA (DUF328/UPF0246 family)